MDNEGLTVVHAIPGRIRLKVPQVRDSPLFANQIEQRLATIPGIQKVTINPLTSSVLVLYDTAVVASPESFQAFAEPLSALFPGVAVKDLETLQAMLTNGTSAVPPLATGVRAFFASLNAQVNTTTAGAADLKLLLPLALFALGIRSLLVSEKRISPTWYDFLWFALGTYFMLNPKPEERQP